MMKYGILTTLILTSVSAFSADAVLDPIALAHFQNRQAVEYTDAAGRSQTHEFNQLITRVDVSQKENPFGIAAGWLSCSGVALMQIRCVEKEIYIYAGEEQLNCNIVFQSEIGKPDLKVQELKKCK
jgi:hypothetical protein